MIDLGGIFDAAFDQVGLREEVLVLGAGDSPPSFQARFEQPQQIIIQDQVHDTDYSIEYTTASVPRLTVGATLQIRGARYRVKQPPVMQGDGHWSIAELEKIR